MTNPELPMPPSANVSDGFRPIPSVFAILGDAAAERSAQEAVTLAGARIVASVGFGEARDRLEMQAALDVILIDAIGAHADDVDAALGVVLDTARETGARIVAIFEEEQLDAIAAPLLGEDVQLLCAPSLAERASALALAGRSGRAVFHDSGRENEATRLRRLNEQVAEIAQALAKLTQEDDSYGRQPLRDRQSDYAPPPIAEAERSNAVPTDVSAAEVRDVIRLRRLRARFFDAGLFADPAWDMLLDLFAARLERARVSVSSLCIAAEVPPTTALRWISTMTEAELFEREADPHDRRRAYIVLSERAADGMSRYFASAKQAQLALA
ncbi:hypothetical protein [Stakelama marina]|uniref:MarR family transcriptional regulator n=1 Tax=Stakelama marina TaxID=2826939 RepID=A0A8T4IFT3_9SPHN|nr:hypothetical protein [Stakelama marina]MBR0553868.1 hypothetical protein [Stakelama marina]